MCGIVGFLQKDPSAAPKAAPAIMAMLRALARRGPDSAGVALYGPPIAHGLVVRAWYGDDEEAAGQAVETVRGRWDVRHADLTAGYLRLELATDASARDVADALAAAGLEVFSAGRSLEIVKHQVDPTTLGERYGLESFPARHG